MLRVGAGKRIKARKSVCARKEREGEIQKGKK
jgi:hypothetical protein